MKKRWIAFVLGVTACASTDAVLGGLTPPPEDSTVPPPPSVDAGPAEAAVDAAPCADCEYFPEECTPGVLCVDGPFDPTTHGDGFDIRTRLTAIRGRSATDVWVAGSLGALAHFDGASWTRSDPGSRESMLGLWLRDGSEVAIGVFDAWTRPWVYSRGGTPPENGAPPSAGGWTLSAPTLPSMNETDIEVLSAWAAPGSEWIWLTIGTYNSNTSTSGLLRLRQSPSTFELAVGPASSCWPGCNRMTSIHGASANDVWAVGANGTAMHIGDATSEAPTVTLYDSRTWNALNGVWAESSSVVWAVGAGGTVRRYSGQGLDWEIVPNIPTSVDLNAIWGTSSSDIWVVGDAGVVLHYDGNAWSRVKVAGLAARRPDLTTVWSAKPSHVWVGGRGVVLSLGGMP